MSAPTSANTTSATRRSTPRNRVKAIDLSREMARLLVDFAVQLGDQLFLLGRENQKYHRSAQPDSIQLDISVRNHQTSA